MFRRSTNLLLFIFICGFYNDVLAQDTIFNNKYEHILQYLPNNTAEAEKKVDTLLKAALKSNNKEYINIRLKLLGAAGVAFTFYKIYNRKIIVIK